mgnify:CR=1 FL=1
MCARPSSHRVAAAVAGCLFATLAAVAPSVAEPVRLAQAAPSTLPGGATSLNETYEDWSVVCVQQPAGKRCVLAQTQTQNGQRALTVELDPPKDGSVSGVLLLPLGLALAAGVMLQVDDGKAGGPLAFRTCLPAGCLVPLSFDAATVGALRKGKALKLEARADGGQAIRLTIPLRGFSNALDRVAALAG